MSFVTYTNKGIYCKPGKFYLDPWRPVDYAIISHGHADHARWGNKKYLCHHHSKPILQHRIGANIQIDSLGYNETKTINGVKVTFFPAGHIIGSAQIKLEYKGYVVVFTGDYKTQPDFLTTPFEPIKCHEFITESTFGLPIYKWKSEEQLQNEVVDWIAENQKNNRTSVFFGYSLGKAQRILKLVENIAPIYVHSAIDKLNSAISSVAIDLPESKLITADFDKKEVQNNIVVLPPALLGSRMLKRIPNAATAICSGWMQIRGNRRWRGADAGFVISDHADWDGLLQTIKETEAEKVYVTHGYQAVLSKYLNEQGIYAKELNTLYGEEELSKSEETIAAE